MRILPLLLLCASCGTASPPPEDPSPGTAAEPAPEVPHYPPAWHVEGGSAVPTADAGLLLTGDGLVPVGASIPCGDGQRVEVDGGLLWLPQGEAVTFPQPAAVSAVIVEAASWRLEEALGPAQGILPGGADAVDPARHKGIRVRSVRKTRRQGAPVQVVVGDRGTSLALMLTDKKAHGGLASAVATMAAPLPEGSRVTVSTAHDLDGDGTLEVVVGAERPDGTQFRQVFHLTLDAPMAVVVGMGVEGATLSCAP